MVVMDMAAMDMAVGTTEASDLLMPTPTLKLKLSHGTDMVMVLTHTPMADTDTHTPMEVITTSERDLLMPNPTMVMEVMAVVAVMDTAVDTVTDMADKKLSSLHY